MSDLIENKRPFIGPTFTLANRLKRLTWEIIRVLFFRVSPAPFHRYRILILRLFGAQVSWRAYVYSDVRIWAPWNLKMDDFSTLGRGVVCYNMSPVTIGKRAVVSQFVHLCTGTHDFRDPGFTLFHKPIAIGASSWICANSFVHPGVSIPEGTVVGACSVVVKSISEPWSIYAGNPCQRIGYREMRLSNLSPQASQ